MSDSPHDDSAQPLRSVHTSNFPHILQQLGVTIVVTTYQAGKLVMLRSEGGVLNTHFRVFDKPMGLAVQSNRMAIGTAMQVWEFHNIPAVCDRLNKPKSDNSDDQQGRVEQTSASAIHPHDACFLPRIVHWTGDIDIHEMAWTNDDLIFVNTRFSTLCRRSATFNFEPVWRPNFIKQYVPGDCCHLNGLAVRDGVVRYVTALGETNEPSGWRANKKDGGVLIDVATGETISRQLSMPHSPRWHNEQLYLLQSGTGGFGTIDLRTGKYSPIVELPGFTRGLSFFGGLAFVGLSQVRETAVFGGVPIAERDLEDRTCGVWAIDTQTGKIVAFVKFEDAVQEIFAVEVLPEAIYPELVNEDRDLLAGSYVLPDDALADVPSELRKY